LIPRDRKTGSGVSAKRFAGDDFHHRRRIIEDGPTHAKKEKRAWYISRGDSGRGARPLSDFRRSAALSLNQHG
jgi:hypothetical protein